jgi:hypothetical protein
MAVLIRQVKHALESGHNIYLYEEFISRPRVSYVILVMRAAFEEDS